MLVGNDSPISIGVWTSSNNKNGEAKVSFVEACYESAASKPATNDNVVGAFRY
jgi:hypothetical protein